MISPRPARHPKPSRTARALAAAGRALRWTVRGAFMLLMVVIPVPIISFLDKTKEKQHQKNLAAQTLKGDEQP